MNSKNSILLVDPVYEAEESDNCRLLIKVNADSLSYAIIESSNDNLKVVYDCQQCASPVKLLAELLKNDRYLKGQFSKTKVSVFTENSITVPNDLFNAEQLSIYGKYFSMAQSKHIYARPVSTFKSTTVFNLGILIENTLNETFENCIRYDHGASHLEMAARTTSNLSFDFSAEAFHVVYSKSGELIFQKYISAVNAEDLNYYILLIIKQLNINPKETPMLLSGIIHEEDAYYKIITKYFSKIRFITPLNYNMDYTILDDMPLHYYSSLLALDLCE